MYAFRLSQSPSLLARAASSILNTHPELDITIEFNSQVKIQL